MKTSKEKYLSIITRGAGFNLIGTVTRTIIIYSYALIVARVSGPEVFGLYNFGLALITILTMLAEMGLGKGIIKHFASINNFSLSKRFKDALQSVLLIGILVSLSVTFITFTSAKVISLRIFQNLHFSPALKIYSISISFLVVSNILISYTLCLKTTRYKVYFRDWVQPFIELIAAIFFLSLGFGIKGLAISYTISHFIIAVFLIFTCNRLVPSLFYNYRLSKFPKNIFRYSVPIMGGDLLLNLLPRISIFIIAVALSSQMLGVYSVVLRISTIHVLVILSFNLIFAPIISELYTKGETQELKILFSQLTTWIVSLTAPILVIIVLFPSFILRLFGEGFIIGRIPLIILCCGQLLNVFTGPVMYMLIMIGRSKEYFQLALLTIVLVTILGLILIPHYGLIGAALADALAKGIMNVTMILLVYKALSIHPYNKSVLIPLSALFFAGLLSYFICRKDVMPLNFPQEAIGSIIFIAVYSIITVPTGLYKKLFSGLIRSN